jgi:hypothetical protein
MGVRKFVGEACAKLVFLLDASGSIREQNPVLDLQDPGYLPEMKAGVALFAANVPPCTCVEYAVFTFASMAYAWTNSTFLTPEALQVPLSKVDYPIDPFCDNLNNYINTDTDFNTTNSSFRNETRDGIFYPLSECLNNQTFFQEQALLYNNYCGRVSCERNHDQGFCGTYPVCHFTNF